MPAPSLDTPGVLGASPMSWLIDVLSAPEDSTVLLACSCGICTEPLACTAVSDCSLTGTSEPENVASMAKSGGRGLLYVHTTMLMIGPAGGGSGLPWPIAASPPFVSKLP